MRPAWAPSSGCKSRREEVILTEANRNRKSGDRLWKGSGEQSRGLMYKNRIRGGAERASEPKIAKLR